MKNLLYSLIFLLNISFAQNLDRVQNIFNSPPNHPAGAVAFSPDGSLLAAGLADSTIKILEANSGRQIASLVGHTSNVSSVAFSPDGSFLASGSYDKTVKIWRTTDFSLITSLEEHTSWVSSVAFSPTGDFLAAGSPDDTAKVWRTADFSLLASLEEHTDSVTLAFSPAGDFLASSSFKTVKIWRTTDFSLLASLEEHTSSVLSLAFSPAEDFLASGSIDNTIKIWRTTDFSLVASLEKHTGSVTSLAFSPAGDFLASSSWDNTVRIWHVNDSYSLHKTMAGVLDYYIPSVAFHPAGTSLALASSKRNGHDAEGVVSLWGTPSRQAVFCPSGCGGIRAPQFAFYNPPQQLSQNQQQLSLQLTIDDGGAAPTFVVHANGGQPLSLLNSKNFSVQAAGLQTLELVIPRSLQNQDLSLVVQASNSAGSASQSLYLAYQQQPIATGRKALIIGNSNYPGRLYLENPHNDAHALQEAFSSLGFAVSLHLDISSKSAFRQAISSFARSLNPEDIAVLYFSGHGMQIHDVNYLIPTQASTLSLATLEEDSVSADYLLREMRNAGVETTIMILDACRNLPDLPQFSSNDKSLLGNGLAPMDRIEGTVIAYAAAPGQKALDSVPNCRQDCELSPYVTHLRRALLNPSLNSNVLRVFEDVQIKVYADTAGIQQPETVSRLYQYVNLGD